MSDNVCTQKCPVGVLEDCRRDNSPWPGGKHTWGGRGLQQSAVPGRHGHPVTVGHTWSDPAAPLHRNHGRS